MHTTKVLLADDHQIVLDGLQEIVGAVPGFQVCGQAKNSRVLLSLIAEHLPDLVLMDLNMPGRDGLETIEEIKARFPGIKILVLTMYDHSDIVQRALALGANGYLVKDHGREELLHAIAEVLEGRLYISKQALAQNLEAQGPFRDTFQAKSALTERELEILRLIAHSYTNKEIGDKLYISEFTVATHRRNLKRKLHAENTADLVRFAYDHDIL